MKDRSRIWKSLLVEWKFRVPRLGNWRRLGYFHFHCVKKKWRIRVNGGTRIPGKWRSLLDVTGILIEICGILVVKFRGRIADTWKKRRFGSVHGDTRIRDGHISGQRRCLLDVTGILIEIWGILVVKFRDRIAATWNIRRWGSIKGKTRIWDYSFVVGNGKTRTFVGEEGNGIFNLQVQLLFISQIDNVISICFASANTCVV